MDYYLYNCNQVCDVENNIGEIEIPVPVFTMEHITKIDTNYKLYLSQVHDIAGPGQYNNLSVPIVNQMNDIFELNDLFMEHVLYIERLTRQMNEYNSHDIGKLHQIQMYFREILPVIRKDENNLDEVLRILSIAIQWTDYVVV